jgi:hypothetical protein|tara:strand:+ start:158 stop:277 length:120 start_codon:yes stop_codon:yes gene_type:complete
LKQLLQKYKHSIKAKEEIKDLQGLAVHRVLKVLQALKAL